MWSFKETCLCLKSTSNWTVSWLNWTIRKTFDDNWLRENAVKILMKLRLIIRVSIFTNISDIVFINSNIKSLKTIEMSHQDIHHTLNHSVTITLMMTIEDIYFEIFSRIIRIIRMTQKKLILILILFIQNSHQIRMILTELRNLFSIQIKFQTKTNINHVLIHSKILHSRMIH